MPAGHQTIFIDIFNTCSVKRKSKKEEIMKKIQIILVNHVHKVREGDDNSKTVIWFSIILLIDKIRLNTHSFYNLISCIGTQVLPVE